MNKQVRAILCPHCGKITDIAEAHCIWCGSATGYSARLKKRWINALNDSEMLIQGVMFLNIGMFVLSLFLNSSIPEITLNPFTALSPDTYSLLLLGATGTEPIDNIHLWWSLGWLTFLSANYLHGGILHILFNMVALKQIAPVVTREYGVYRFLIIYSIGGVIGFYLSYMAGISLTIGASSAICGLLGSLLFFGWSRGGQYGNLVFKQIGSWILTLFIFGFLMSGINNWGHLGGILGGFALGWILGYREKRPETRMDRFTSGIIAVITLLVLGWSVITGTLVRYGNV
ncbi:MAG: rhomboid family intramembrane serine protease [Desulfobacterium sp.]|nr:rhomboid family intramembrane serine protease [Desulfobacterium sp.]